MECLCFGGSFNPVHRAHLACAAAAAKGAGFAKVMFIPNRGTLLKSQDYDLAPASDRVAMLRQSIAFSSYEGVGFSLSTIEIDRATPSYTIDTAEAFLANGWKAVHWLIGADQLLNLHRWHRFEDLIRQVNFWVMARPGYSIDWTRVHAALLGLRARVVEVPQLDISATDIRRRVRSGLPIDHLVLPQVREYILERRLYIPSDEPVQLSD